MFGLDPRRQRDRPDDLVCSRVNSEFESGRLQIKRLKNVLCTFVASLLRKRYVPDEMSASVDYHFRGVCAVLAMIQDDSVCPTNIFNVETKIFHRFEEVTQINKRLTNKLFLFFKFYYHSGF